MILLAILLLTNWDSISASSTRVHNIHWNASNPLFRSRDDAPLLDVNGGNHPWEYDQVNVICPIYKAGIPEETAEKYIVYSVTKQEYETCRITQPNPKIIAVCNQPTELMYFTITFRSFTPTPGGLEFKPGTDYYFISTSSRGDIHRRVGGGCSTHNMRIVFRVADNHHQTKKINTDKAEESVNPVRPLPRQYPLESTTRLKTSFPYPHREYQELLKTRKLYKEEEELRNRRNNLISESSSSIKVVSTLTLILTLFMTQLL